MFQTEEQYDLAVKEAKELALEIVKNYKGRLSCAAIINECLDKIKKVTQSINLAATYAKLAEMDFKALM